MDDLMTWLGDVFYKEVTETTHSEGYVSERYSYSGGTSTIELPYADTTTVTRQVFDWQAGGAFVLVVLTFVTVVTTLRSALLK